MLRINQFKSSKAVVKYYEATLEPGDYYMDKNGQNQSQELTGSWHGELAKQLGIKGNISAKSFKLLAHNINPIDGKQLTIKNFENRRVGYDFTFNVPKSFSIVQALGDDRLLKIFQKTVQKSMQEMEKNMHARIRRNGKSEDRLTGNMVWGDFTHFTARPLDNIPDMHLHAHCFVFNATYDQVEKRIKAGQFGEIKRQADLYQAQFHADLMKEVQNLGYEAELTPIGWEIKGVPQKTINRFSRRTKQIEKEAKDKAIIGIENKAKLGSKTRENKQKAIPMGELKNLWEMQLPSIEKQAIKNTISASYLDKPKPEIDTQELVKDSVQLALDDLLEKNSTTSQKNILKKALILGKGHLSQRDILKEIQARELDRRLWGVDLGRQGVFYTTSQALIEEKKIISLMNSGKGKFDPIKLDKKSLELEELSEEQKQSIITIFDSTDAVVSVRGGAGTGKTSFIKSAVHGLQKAGKKVYLFAPTARASRSTLRDEGFKNADTVARLIQSSEKNGKLQGSLIWIDESGLLSNQEMQKALEIARSYNARIVLTGDTKQHTSVARGDAMRLLENKTDLEQTALTKIFRQKPEIYRQAIEHIQNGQTDEAFDLLEKMGVIVEDENPQKRYKKLAEDYTKITQSGQSVAVVSPTRIEGEHITNFIRQELKNEGLIAKEDRQYQILKNRKLTKTQSRSRVLEEGTIVQFHDNQIKEYGLENNTPYTVHIDTYGFRYVEAKMKNEKGKSTIKKPVLLKDGWENIYSTYYKQNINLATGDTIRITQNSRLRYTKNVEITSGQKLEIVGFGATGNIQAIDSKTQKTYLLPKDFGNFEYGLVSTSQSFQGGSVDHILIGQSSGSFSATDRKQFYVSTSRGKQGISIYTDDKNDLREAVRPAKTRMSAHELMDLRHAKLKAEYKQKFPTQEEPLSDDFKPENLAKLGQNKPQKKEPYTGFEIIETDQENLKSKTEWEEVKQKIQPPQKYKVIKKTIYPKPQPIKKPTAKELKEKELLVQKVKDIFSKKTETQKENPSAKKFSKSNLQSFDTNKSEKHISEIMAKNWQKVVQKNPSQTEEEYQKSRDKKESPYRSVGR